MTDRTTADKPCLPPYSPEQRRELIGPLLQAVSRSFYLTLRVLPAPIRPQISLAYLLARATDTIADTEVLPAAQRVETLREYAENIKAPTSRRTQNFGAQQLAAALPGEQQLLNRLPDCLQMLAAFSTADRELITGLLETIIRGQIFDLERFREGTLTALGNDTELDRYTYLVAGCVGEFWTQMCQAHLPGLENLSIAAGVRFGKGLQLVNILRDLPRDYTIGRCYLPVQNPHDPAEVGPVYTKWLDTAVAHLDAGWEYTLAIPANQKRLRLACVWPLWIGLKTIARLRHANPLDPTQRVKVARAEVYGIMAQSIVRAGNAAGLDRIYQRLRQPAA